MTALASPPMSFLDPRTGAPAFGAYAGPLPAVRLDVGLRARVLRRKQWFYVAFATREVWVAVGVVKTGYAGTAFGFAYDLEGRVMLANETALGPGLAARVSDALHDSGVVARFRFGRNAVSITRDGPRLDVDARLGDLAIDAQLDERDAPPPVAAIARLDDVATWDATEKRALVAAKGRARCGGREISLDAARAGYDFTYGLMPRRTRWRWAFALGQDSSGEPFGLNLTEGFCGHVDGAAFSRGAVHPLAEPKLTYPEGQPLAPWRVAGEGIDLAFTPGALHSQSTKLWVVQARFVQPVGTFSGTVRLGDREVRLVDVPGVVEDQDTLW